MLEHSELKESKTFVLEDLQPFQNAWLWNSALGMRSLFSLHVILGNNFWDSVALSKHF